MGWLLYTPIVLFTASLYPWAKSSSHTYSHAQAHKSAPFLAASVCYSLGSYRSWPEYIYCARTGTKPLRPCVFPSSASPSCIACAARCMPFCPPGQTVTGQNWRTDRALVNCSHTNQLESGCICVLSPLITPSLGQHFCSPLPRASAPLFPFPVLVSPRPILVHSPSAHTLFPPNLPRSHCDR
ncbi:unnamed protein product [Protopolystoma xenopodis]|uniref:4Fe-4S ferredoxin-type domain-containing protein n=1 Tax=Protopolystoma xenopodis TaxID=117903 RepID=A0A448WNX5_9PLAT|nr:unnamed protein product [Protopolystoma xenopodis]